MPYVADATDVAQPTDVGVAASTAPSEFRELKIQLRDYLNGTDAIPGGIKFPAVQVPSADANTLDDYEEGTWNPTVSGVTIGGVAGAYPVRDAFYIKIGKLVYVQCWLEWTGHTGTGQVIISGWPFAAAAGAALTSALAIDYTYPATYPAFVWMSAPLGTFDFMLPGGRFAAVTLDANGGFIFSGAYRASA